MRIITGWDADWLWEAESPWDAGAAVVRNWKPAEPQMVMTLAREKLGFTNFATKMERPPRYGQPPAVPLVLYRARQTCRDLSFLAWMRQHTWSGNEAE